MQAHFVALNKFNAAQAAFSGHCRLGQWDEAERMQAEATAYVDEAFDAFRRACELGLRESG